MLHHLILTPWAEIISLLYVVQSTSLWLNDKGKITVFFPLLNSADPSLLRDSDSASNLAGTASAELLTEFQLQSPSITFADAYWMDHAELQRCQGGSI